MTILSRLVALIDLMIQRRRHHWVEVSLTRAWSRDLPPRLFDLDNR